MLCNAVVVGFTTTFSRVVQRPLFLRSPPPSSRGVSDSGGQGGLFRGPRVGDPPLALASVTVYNYYIPVVSPQV